MVCVVAAIFLPQLCDCAIRGDMVRGGRWSLLEFETMDASRCGSDDRKGDNKLVQHGGKLRESGHATSCLFKSLTYRTNVPTSQACLLGFTALTPL
jgi:hypothetical protein